MRVMAAEPVRGRGGLMEYVRAGAGYWFLFRRAL